MIALLVPALKTRGYTSLPVHFLGKAATFCLLYAFPLVLLGLRRGTGRWLARVLGWAFAIWGTGLYWYAGLLYLGQTRTVLRTSPAAPADAGPGTSGTDGHPDPYAGRRPPSARRRQHGPAQPDHPAAARSGLRHRRRPGRRGPAARPLGPGAGRGADRRAVRGGGAPDHPVSAGAADRAQRADQPDPAGRGASRTRCAAAGPTLDAEIGQLRTAALGDDDAGAGARAPRSTALGPVVGPRGHADPGC